MNKKTVFSIGTEDFKSNLEIEQKTNKKEHVQIEITNIQNFEDILNYLGGFGLFQFLSLFLILILEIPTAFVTIIPVFISQTPTQWFCNNQSMNQIEICNCNDKIWTNLKDSSIVGEWNLICSSSWVPDFITSLGMLGMLFGNLIACKISDWYGRRYTFLPVSLLMTFGHLASGALIVSPHLYGACRFITGIGISGYLGISSIYALEFQTPKWRQVCSSVGPWGEGVMLLALIAYKIHDWRKLIYFTSIPFCLILIIFPLLPESPRWLIRNQKYIEAQQVLQYISKINRQPLSSCNSIVDISLLKKISEDIKNEETKMDNEEIVGTDTATTATVVKRFGYIEFFIDPALRLPTIYQMTIMCSTAITYYGISFNVKNMEGSIYLIVFLLGLSDTIGYPSALLICNRLGRRTSLAIYMSLGALFLGALAVLEFWIHLSTIPTTVIVLCLLGKFCVAGGRSCARTLVGELYPTAVRTMGSGLGGVGASLGAILAPQLAYLGSHWPSIPYFVFAFIAITGALFSFLLTETMGKPLCDNVCGICPSVESEDENLSSSSSSISVSDISASFECTETKINKTSSEAQLTSSY